MTFPGLIFLIPQVYYFPESVLAVGGEVTADCGAGPAPCPGRQAGLQLTPTEQDSLFGSALAWEQVASLHCIALHWTTQVGETVVVVVAAERSSLGARMGGALYFFQTEIANTTQFN